MTSDSAVPKDDSGDVVEYEDDFEPDDTADDDGQLSLHTLNFSIGNCSEKNWTFYMSLDLSDNVCLAPLRSFVRVL